MAQSKPLDSVIAIRRLFHLCQELPSVTGVLLWLEFITSSVHSSKSRE